MPRILLATVITLGLLTLTSYEIHGGVVGLWLLDEGKGEIAADSSENGNDGSLTGAIKWSDSGKIGACIEGDGSVGWVEIPSSESLTRGAGPFTVMAWAKANVAGNHGIFAKSSDAPVKHQDWGLYIFAGKVRFSGNWPEGWTKNQFMSQSDVEVGKWTHLAVTWGDGKLTFYIDGEVDTEFEWDLKFNDSEAPLVIGADPAGGDEVLNGFVDEVAMFDEVLSQQDIQKTMGGLESAVMPVESPGKLLTTWAKIKGYY